MIVRQEQHLSKADCALFGLGTFTCIVFLNITLSLECWYA